MEHRCQRVLILTAILAVATAGIALAAKPGHGAAKPVKGARYKGAIHWSPNAIDSFPIAFTVSKKGDKVQSFQLSDSFPVYCRGGGFPAIGDGGSGRISKRGTFTAKLPLTDLTTQKHEGFVIVTGAFGTRGSVSGKVATDLPGAVGKACNGTSPFTART
jgi:hypothetical protein